MEKSWEFVKGKIHDTSGIQNPEEWFWKQSPLNNCYYPSRKLDRPVEEDNKKKSWEWGGEKSRYL